MKESIQVENLVKQYGDNRAVDGVSFSVKEGSFFGFLGPNGAGKTTTMRILSTLLKKTSGQVTVAGFDIEQEPERVRQNIGFAMQDISLDNLANAWENLQLLGVLYGLTPAQARTRAAELLEVVGLTKVADSYVNSYSGGMRRRLDLAGVLMHQPKILFLDEPTQGLDPQARRTIWDYLRQLNKEGTTMFLTTHYMDEAEQLCEELAFIDKGKLVAKGTPAHLKSQMGGDLITLEFPAEDDLVKIEAVIKPLLGSKGSSQRLGTSLKLTVQDADKLVPKLVGVLAEKKFLPTKLSSQQPSLEDVFVKLVGHTIHEANETEQLVKGRDPFVEGRR